MIPLLFISKELVTLIKRIIIISTTIIFLLYILHPGRFALSNYPCITTSDISNTLESYPDALKISEKAHKPLCTIQLFDNTILYPNLTTTDLNELTQRLDITEGGRWQPKDCVANYHIAIIIPYRDRRVQLNIFLVYIHPFLQMQKLDYIIIVVEQTNDAPFNRAKLFNIGFVEALKIKNVNCFIFHDVDLLPQNLANIYACTKMPRHMSSSLNTFRYNLPYLNLFGGAIAITKQHFLLVNGFSNEFYGWGGEDDDFQNRIISKGLSICRFEPDISKYVMISHKKESPSKDRFLKLKYGSSRFEIDGLNNLHYIIHEKQLMNLYTWLKVEI